MATQKVRYVGRHTGGIEIPVDGEYVEVKHHGEVELPEKLARELVKRGDFNPVKEETSKKKDD